MVTSSMSDRLKIELEYCELTESEAFFFYKRHVVKNTININTDRFEEKLLNNLKELNKGFMDIDFKTKETKNCFRYDEVGTIIDEIAYITKIADSQIFIKNNIYKLSDLISSNNNLDKNFYDKLEDCYNNMHYFYVLLSKITNPDIQQVYILYNGIYFNISKGGGDRAKRFIANRPNIKNEVFLENICTDEGTVDLGFDNNRTFQKNLLRTLGQKYRLYKDFYGMPKKELDSWLLVADKEIKSSKLFKEISLFLKNFRLLLYNNLLTKDCFEETNHFYRIFNYFDSYEELLEKDSEFLDKKIHIKQIIKNKNIIDNVNFKDLHSDEYGYLRKLYINYYRVIDLAKKRNISDFEFFKHESDFPLPGWTYVNYESEQPERLIVNDIEKQKLMQYLERIHKEYLNVFIDSSYEYFSPLPFDVSINILLDYYDEFYEWPNDNHVWGEKIEGHITKTRKLSRFMKTVRKKFKHRELSTNLITLLDSYGFNWSNL